MSQTPPEPANPYAARPAVATTVEKPKTSVLAVLSFVFGLMSFLFLCISGIIGIILGITALLRIKNSGGRLTGTSYAIIGISLSIVLSVFSSLLLGMLLPAVQQVREAARRTMTENNMRQISLAQLNYETSQAQFPGWKIGSSHKGSGLSWRVHLLPFMDEQPLYLKFNFDEPWDSPTNKALIPLMPEIYRSVGGRGGDQLELGETLYLRPIGNGAWPDPNSPDFQSPTVNLLKDGLSDTAAIVEANISEAVIWTKPDGDYQFDPNNPTRGLGGQRVGGTAIAFADGSSILVSNDVPEADYKALFTINGGEDFMHPAYR